MKSSINKADNISRKADYLYLDNKNKSALKGYIHSMKLYKQANYSPGKEYCTYMIRRVRSKL